MGNSGSNPDSWLRVSAAFPGAPSDWWRIEYSWRQRDLSPLLCNKVAVQLNRSSVPQKCFFRNYFRTEGLLVPACVSGCLLGSPFVAWLSVCCSHEKHWVLATGLEAAAATATIAPFMVNGVCRVVAAITPQKSAKLLERESESVGRSSN